MQQTRPHQTKLSAKSVQQRKKKQKQRSFAAIWDDTEGEEKSSNLGNEKADLCFMADSDDSDDDEPSEISKLFHSDLLFERHRVNGRYEKPKERYEKLELEKKNFVELTEELERQIEIIKMIYSRDDRRIENELKKSKEKIESLGKENMILKNSKIEIIQINYEFEKVIEKFKDFEKCESGEYKSFESKMIEFETKIKELENENLVLKRIDCKKRKKCY